MPYIEPRPSGSVRITVYDRNIRYKKTISQKELAGLSERQKEKYINQAAVLFETSIENGTYLDGEKITLSEFLNKWIRDYAEKQLAPGTLKPYISRIENRIIPAMGHIIISKIQPHHLLEFYNNLSEEGMRLNGRYSPSEACLKLLNVKDIGVSTKTLIRLKKGEKNHT